MTGKGPKRPGSGRLDEDDLGLWRQVTKSLKPLAGREVPPERAAPKPPAPDAAARPAAKPRASSPAGNAAPDQPRTATKPSSPGTLHDIDKRTADRLKRGKLPVEARLDLHGMTQARAEQALARFLADAQAAGLRNVLLITGKGKADGGGARGVLRRELPRWLNQPRNRERVVALTPAQPKDGGDGAFYVRLKRLRERR